MYDYIKLDPRYSGLKKKRRRRGWMGERKSVIWRQI
jgi:hypothetical protein